MAQTTITLERPPLEAAAVRLALVDEGFVLSEAQYAFFRAKRAGCTITFYTKGKVVIQANDPQQWVPVVAPDQVEKAPIEDARKKHPKPPPARWIGIDETGKGDYFGPLVVVAAAVDRDRIGLLAELGVDDSKKITDKRVLELSGQLKTFCKFKKLIVRPERYNPLYEKIGNLNRMLAWGHAASLEDLLEQEPDIGYAISDQFAKSKDTLLRALKPRGKEIRFDQWHKAESDPAVAVASVLARAEFLWQMRRLSREAGQELPKGAGPQVLAAARKLIAREGTEVLGRYAKLHFKTTEQL